MKTILFRSISVIAMMVILSGCSETEGLIESVESLIKNVDKMVQDEAAKDGESATSEETESTGKAGVTTVAAETEVDEHEGEDPATMFGEGEDEGSVSPDFFHAVSPYYDLYEGNIDHPNGYFMPMYDDWQLVAEMENGDNGIWQGKFCHDSNPYNVAQQYFADIEELGLHIDASWFEDDGQETAEGFDHRRFAYYYGADYSGTIKLLELPISGKIEFFTDSRGEYCAVSTIVFVD